MRLDYDNKRTRTHNTISGAVDTETKSAYELFAEFFEKQNNAAMSDEQSEYMKALIEKIEEEMA
jgi:exonuclease SbcD